MSDTTIHVRVPSDVVEHVDELARLLSLPGAARTRASVVRWLVTEGAVRELEARRSAPEKRPEQPGRRR